MPLEGSSRRESIGDMTTVCERRVTLAITADNVIQLFSRLAAGYCSPASPGACTRRIHLVAQAKTCKGPITSIAHRLMLMRRDLTSRYVAHLTFGRTFNASAPAIETGLHV